MAEPAVSAATVLLLDDHGIFREGVARLLEGKGFGTVTACAGVAEALSALAETPPDVVLLDFDLGHRDGLDFLRSARERGFSGRVLVVTAGVDDLQAAELIAAGVSGIFTKHDSAAELAGAIRVVLEGKAWFDPELLRRASSATVRGREGREARFTERERRVLSHVFEGLANKQIASRIGASESAVKATLQQLFAKTGVRTRSQLVRIALERYQGLL